MNPIVDKQQEIYEIPHKTSKLNKLLFEFPKTAQKSSPKQPKSTSSLQATGHFQEDQPTVQKPKVSSSIHKLSPQQSEHQQNEDIPLIPQRNIQEQRGVFAQKEDSLSRNLQNIAKQKSRKPKTVRQSKSEIPQISPNLLKQSHQNSQTQPNIQQNEYKPDNQQTSDTFQSFFAKWGKVILITIAVIIIAIFVFMWYRDNQVKRNKPETKIDPEKQDLLKQQLEENKQKKQSLITKLTELKQQIAKETNCQQKIDNVKSYIGSIWKNKPLEQISEEPVDLENQDSVPEQVQQNDVSDAMSESKTDNQSDQQKSSNHQSDHNSDKSDKEESDKEESEQSESSDEDQSNQQHSQEKSNQTDNSDDENDDFLDSQQQFELKINDTYQPQVL